MLVCVWLVGWLLGWFAGWLTGYWAVWLYVWWLVVMNLFGGLVDWWLLFMRCLTASGSNVLDVWVGCAMGHL